MKRTVYFCLFLSFAAIGKAGNKQPIDSTYIDSIRNIEYQLEGLSFNIINGEDVNERITSCYYFIQTLKKALKVPTSFDYTFTKLKTVSILKPKDEKFRIFTWNLLLDSNRYIYFGAIQMNTDTDSLILFGLHDSSDKIKNPEFEVLDNRHWIGALYYQVHEFKQKGDTYYMLFGWDGDDAKINKKVVDILWFDENDKPQFGAPFFLIDDDFQNRLIFEFADYAVMLCRYDDNEKAIVYANMIPPNPLQAGRYEYYIPDGTYNFLKFTKGFWINSSNELFLDRQRYRHELRNRSPFKEEQEKNNNGGKKAK
jgi:hypothetical protein